MTEVEEIHVHRQIAAARERVFAAWTTPEQIVRWWGGGGVTCPEAFVDLRTGGEYRIANQLPDGTVNWICGAFEVVDPPAQLVYSWQVGAEDGAPIPGDPTSIVTVDFESRDEGTSLTIRHQRIPNGEARNMFEAGWHSCVAQLKELLEG